jgi:Skp family chaperone for outer membrane proteins
MRLAAALLVTFLAMVGPAAPVLAQDERELGIVVIDTQKIYREAVAVRGLQKKIDDQRSSYQNELRGKEEVLRGADQELARQRTILSSEAFAQKRRELEQQVAKLQGEVQSRRKDLEKEFALGMKEVQAALVEIAREIAEERRSDLVIEKSAVVLVRPELEITQEALKRLDKRLPTIAPLAPQD